MSGRQRRLKAQLALSSLICVLLFVSLGLWLASAQGSFSDVVLTSVWWASLFAGAACGIAACRIDDDTSEDTHYLESLLAGLRREWQQQTTTRGR